MSKFSSQSDNFIFKNRVFRRQIAGDSENIKKDLIDYYVLKSESGFLSFLPLACYSALIEIILNFLSSRGIAARKTTTLYMLVKESYFIISIFDKSFFADDIASMNIAIKSFRSQNEKCFIINTHVYPATINMFIKPVNQNLDSANGST